MRYYSEFSSDDFSDTEFDVYELPAKRQASQRKKVTVKPTLVKGGAKAGSSEPWPAYIKAIIIMQVCMLLILLAIVTMVGYQLYQLEQAQDSMADKMAQIQPILEKLSAYR